MIITNHYRIAIGGFHHETNSFSPSTTTLDAFLQADGWPALSRGEALLPAVEGMNLPITGFAEAMRDHTLLPLLWCSAPPGGEVTREAYETILAMLLEDLQRALPVDAVYLDLHGAMIAEHHPDGDGETLRRVRALVGDAVPIVLSLDMHANLSDAMVRISDGIAGYRTYPHVDMAETGVRSAAMLLEMLATGTRPDKRHRKLPYLIPLTAQCTRAEPLRSFFASLPDHASFFTGFPPSDVCECGPSLVSYGPALAHHKRLEAQLLAMETAFTSPLYTPDAAIETALASPGLTVIADTQDNPGAGAPSNTTGMLEAMLRHHAPGVLGLLHDPHAAAAAHQAGESAVLTIGIGDPPVTRSWKVLRLGDGNFTATGPMYGGSKMALGPMTLLEYEGVRVVLSSVRQQAGDQSMLLHLGIEPAEEKLLILKSSVHFRADFMGVASRILVAEAPGLNIEDPEKFHYTRLRDGVRRRPRIS